LGANCGGRGDIAGKLLIKITLVIFLVTEVLCKTSSQGEMRDK